MGIREEIRKEKGRKVMTTKWHRHGRKWGERGERESKEKAIEQFTKSNESVTKIEHQLAYILPRVYRIFTS